MKKETPPQKQRQKLSKYVIKQKATAIMTSPIYQVSLVVIVLVLVNAYLQPRGGNGVSSGDSDAKVCRANDQSCHVLHEWVTLDFLWPNATMKEQYIKDGRYDPTHCYLSGVKVYRDHIFVTVPRLRYIYGVPAPLNRVVIDTTDGNKPKLEPFPNWEMQQQGSNCDNLQMAMSIEIDPVTGYLYLIDPGRPGVIGTPEPNVPPPFKCPPKLVIFDINAKSVLRSYELPASVASKETNYLNDIVLDRGPDPDSRTVRWVYITDALDSKLYVVDLEANTTRAIHHASMDYEDSESTIEVNGRNFTLKLPIDGLAMTRDFEFVYYCALGSLKLYRVPTFVLRDAGGKYDHAFGDYVTLVGDKVSQTGGMIYATTSLYYGGLAKSAIYKWDVAEDMKNQRVPEGNVSIVTEIQEAKDDDKMIWPDAFAIDEDGYLYVTTCRANLFIKGGMDFTGGQGSNFRIWKIRVDELGYLSPLNTATAMGLSGWVGFWALLVSMCVSLSF